jgi:hypothetical protein
VVDQEHVGARRLPRLLQLLELALADVGARLGACAVLHELSYRLDLRGARELADLAEFGPLVGVRGQHGDDEPALELVGRDAWGPALRHRPIMPRRGPPARPRDN